MQQVFCQKDCYVRFFSNILELQCGCTYHAKTIVFFIYDQIVSRMVFLPHYGHNVTNGS